MDARFGRSRAPLPRWRLRARQRVATWGAVAAWLLGLWGVGELIRWGNRWYIVEKFHGSASAVTAQDWRWLYGLLEAAHQTLVLGLVLLLISAAFAGAAVAARRSLRGLDSAR